MLFWGKEQKCAWSQPASWCALSGEFSGKVTFLNIPCCWWGICETWAKAQRLHIKQHAAFAAPPSDWFYQSHFLYPSSGGQESYICIRSLCWGADWDIKTHKLKKGYRPCTSPYFLVVPPATQLCSDHECDGNSLDLLTSAGRAQRGKSTMGVRLQRWGRCLGGPRSDVCYTGPQGL